CPRPSSGTCTVSSARRFGYRTKGGWRHELDRRGRGATAARLDRRLHGEGDQQGTVGPLRARREPMRSDRQGATTRSQGAKDLPRRRSPLAQVPVDAVAGESETTATPSGTATAADLLADRGAAEDIGRRPRHTARAAPADDQSERAQLPLADPPSPQ